MDERIQKLVEAGRAKIAASEAQEVERQQKIEAYQLARRAKLNDLAVALLPEALRSYARVESDDCFLVVEIPGCAVMKRAIMVAGDDKWETELSVWLQDVSKVYFSETNHDRFLWSIYTWRAVNFEGEWLTCHAQISDDGIDDLERALAMAAEVGDNHDAILAGVAARNSAAQQSQPEPGTFTPREEQRLTCPLKAANGFEFDECEKGSCAWYNGMHCAILSISVSVGAQANAGF